MYSLFSVIDQILGLYWLVVILAAVLSWLVGFGIINRSNQLVAMIYEAVWRLTDPIFSYFRRFLPYLGGIDISPIIVLLIIFFLRSFLREMGLVV